MTSFVLRNIITKSRILNDVFKPFNQTFQPIKTLYYPFPIKTLYYPLQQFALQQHSKRFSTTCLQCLDKRTFISSSIGWPAFPSQSVSCSFTKKYSNQTLSIFLTQFNRSFSTTQILPVTLNQVRRKKVKTKRKFPKRKMAPEKRILFGPQRKGICVKCVVRTPRKPNSAKRKCAVLRLNNGKLITAYIPGERANLQEHGVVLFRGGRVQDCPGVKYKIIRGKFDIN